MKNDNLARLLEEMDDESGEKMASTADFLSLVPEPTKEDLEAVEKELEKDLTPMALETKKKVNDVHVTDTLELYIKDIRKYPPLTKEEEQELFKPGNFDRDKFINHNLYFVVKIAKKYVGNGMDLLDLIQEGNFGLMHAVKKFDYRKGFRFSTYSIWWIRQYCTTALANKSKNIRIPFNVVEKINKLQRVEKYLGHKMSQKASNAEIAKQMSLEVEVIEKLKEIKNQIKTISLSIPVGEDGDSQLEGFIADSHGYSPEDISDQNSQEEIILEAFRCDRKKIFEIIRRQNVLPKIFLTGKNSRFSKSLKEVLKEMSYPAASSLFGDEKLLYVLTLMRNDFTLEEIGKEFNITRERVRQLNKKAMQRIGNALRAKTMKHLRC